MPRKGDSKATLASRVLTRGLEEHLPSGTWYDIGRDAGNGCYAPEAGPAAHTVMPMCKLSVMCVRGGGYSADGALR